MLLLPFASGSWHSPQPSWSFHAPCHANPITQKSLQCPADGLSLESQSQARRLFPQAPLDAGNQTEMEKCQHESCWAGVSARSPFCSLHSVTAEEEEAHRHEPSMTEPMADEDEPSMAEVRSLTVFSSVQWVALTGAQMSPQVVATSASSYAKKTGAYELLFLVPRHYHNPSRRRRRCGGGLVHPLVVHSTAHAFDLTALWPTDLTSQNKTGAP